MSTKQVVEKASQSKELFISLLTVPLLQLSVALVIPSISCSRSMLNFFPVPTLTVTISGLALRVIQCGTEAILA